MTPPGSTTSIGMTTSNANPTVSTPAPVLTDAVQRCVDTAAEVIATHREARLIFMQGLVRRILREAYRESTNPPSVGIPLAQSVLDGIPSTSRGLYPFVTHPNYHNGQIHYPPNPFSQPPTTSATTTTTRMTSTQKASTGTTSTTNAAKAATSCSNTIPTIAGEAHRNHTVFAPMTLVESLTKTNLLLIADNSKTLL